MIPGKILQQVAGKKHSIVRDFIVYNAALVRATGKFRTAGVLLDIKHFSQWWKYRNSPESPLQYEIPWLVFDAIQFLDGWLKKDMNVFEYGSGGSTIYWAKRAGNLVSVEHDREWYNMVAGHIAELKLSNTEYILSEPETDASFDQKSAQCPADFISSRAQYKGKNFDSYAKQIEKYPPGYFDLVIVDGRVRASCIMLAMDKIKKGGILLLDNADRKAYIEPFPELKDRRKWKLKKYAGHFPFSPASVLNETYLFEKL